MNTTHAFFKQGIRVVSIKDWLDWAVCADTEEVHRKIVLPMIQRGSVWKPHQVIDLWDTILRGMPFGGLMASQISSTNGGSEFFNLIDREPTDLREGSGLSLIDGQQRTLAMLLAWPKVGTQMNRRLWIDFGEDDQTPHQKFDHLLRFHLATESHPFGYQPGGNSGEPIKRLTMSDRRRAAAAYADLAQADKGSLLHHPKITPWRSTMPVDMRLLISKYQSSSTLSDFVLQQNKEQIDFLENRIVLIKGKQPPFSEYDQTLRDDITKHLERRLGDINKISPDHLRARILKLETGLYRMFNQHFPVIEVPSDMIDAREDDDTQDPPLAVLFKRIGTGGTDLKTSDYVFSVIKHRTPECHSLVENQLKNDKIAAIYAPTELVMSAVRLTAAKLELPDYVKLDKKQFNGLLRGTGNKTRSGDEGLSFLEEFKRQIGSEGSFVLCLQAVLKAIAYRPPANNDAVCSPDIGLPKHALCLVEIAALEIVLLWLQKQSGLQEEIAQNNRTQLIRFLLNWQLSVLDTPQASTVCFKELSSQSNPSNFPDKYLMSILVGKELALPICCPDELSKIETLPVRLSDKDNEASFPAYLTQSDGVPGLRGWRRFEEANVKGSDESDKIRRIEAIKLYKRWWNLRGGYCHTLLLWLQRDYVYRQFEEKPVLPGMEEDTPYDFDHICPQNHWSGWTGAGKGSRLIDFHAEKITGADKEGHWRLGNAIGNVRVWNSSDNRGDGDTAPSIKLKLTSLTETEQRLEVIQDASDARQRLWDSAINSFTESGLINETLAWVACSPVTVTDNPKHWTLERAQAFQKAIEQRTFNLYQRFYTDLNFREWAD